MKEVAKANLIQIKQLIENLDSDQYSQKVDVLSGGTLGQHIRHIIEFYLLLVSGSETGNISYDKRKRDLRIETDNKFAVSTLSSLIVDLDNIDVNKSSGFEADYSTDGSLIYIIKSSVGRELAYCIEHSIHHLAIIKAGLISMKLEHLTDEKFGVASSTLRYRKEICAQ